MTEREQLRKDNEELRRRLAIVTRAAAVAYLNATDLDPEWFDLENRNRIVQALLGAPGVLREAERIKEQDRAIVEAGVGCG